MPDTRLNPERRRLPTCAILRKDYRPPDWLVPEIALEFELDPERTRVRATLSVDRNGAHDRPLRLDGDELTPLSVVDGGEAAGRWMARLWWSRSTATAPRSKPWSSFSRQPTAS